ncbi:MAG: hypothetical protein IT436_17315 [Phycisphaerales bacterium]|nr:hypothetical protein [Phycisphaerales bacterium]
MKRQAGQTLTPDEARDLERGYLWVQGGGNVFTTVPLNGPMTREQWDAYAKRRNAENAKRQAENRSALDSL